MHGLSDMNAHRNIVKEALLLLLKAGLWGKPTDCSTVFPLTDLEWKQLLNEARKQTVEGIVYEGLSLLPEKWLPTENILFRWAAEAEHIEQRNQKMNGVLAELQQLFTAHGLHPVVLKGQATALCYRQPSLRQCGDIDWFFPSPEEEQQAAALIRKSGCRIEDKPDGSRLYAWKGIEVEHHPQLLDCCNPFVQKKIHHWIAQEGWKEAVIANGTTISTPAPLLHLLLLNTHILKHALGRGIGLRQLCDLARAYATVGLHADGTAYQEACSQLGLLRWNRLLHAFLIQCLGLPAETLPYPEPEPVSPAPLQHKVWSGGNFGQHDARFTEKTSKWKRKQDTARAFLANAKFACSYAPSEAFWTMTHLIKGQFLCN